MRVIRTRDDYYAALEQLEELMGRDLDPWSGDGERLEDLADTIEEYERREFPVGLPTPSEAIKFRMEQQGLTETDLVEYIGSAKKVARVLAGELPLTLTMIHTLHRVFGIPLSVLGPDEVRGA